MKFIQFYLVSVFLTILLAPSYAVAHRVNIFAWMEGDDVAVECGFSRDSPARDGRITVFDAKSGEELLQGVTDKKGHFRFPVPQSVRRDAHGLRIRVNAGEGHQSEWLIAADELTLSCALPDARTQPSATEAAAHVAASASLLSMSGDGDTQEAVRRIINEALDAKLAPIRHDLAAAAASGPGLQEIIGGIGWILGIAGIALYFKGRRG
ncbi:MAG: pollen Ole e 1 allergen/extensin family protein [Desulfovibrio sp.]|jgi:nickel transport protein|nr:pollen Ole e 1 allergen/extensin family protein [Desulfovibrio sp.]